LYVILLLAASSFSSDAATLEFYSLSLHDALPILVGLGASGRAAASLCLARGAEVTGFDEHLSADAPAVVALIEQSVTMRCGELRSEEHTSELQSRENLVCRLLHEKKNTKEIGLST